MSDSILAVFSIGWLAGVVTAVITIGVIKGERHNKRQHGDDFIRIDLIPCGDRNRSGDIGRDNKYEREIREQAKRLGVKIGG